MLKFFDGVPLQSFLGLRGPLRLHHGGHGHGGHGHGGHGEHGHGGYSGHIFTKRLEYVETEKLDFPQQKNGKEPEKNYNFCTTTTLVHNHSILRNTQPLFLK